MKYTGIFSHTKKEKTNERIEKYLNENISAEENMLSSPWRKESYATKMKIKIDSIV